MGTTHFSDLEVAEDLVTTDDVTAGDDLVVTDDASVGGNLTVTGTLGVTGDSTMGNTEVDGTFKVKPGTTGGFTLKKKEAVSAAMSGASVTMTLEVPVGAIVKGVQLRVDTLITADTGVSWTATFSGGLTTQIATGLAFTKNTKANVFMDVNAAAAIVTGSVANIALTPNAGTFTAGVVRAIVYYEEFDAMADAA